MTPTKGDINETCRNDSLAYINALNSVSFRITAKFEIHQGQYMDAKYYCTIHFHALA